MTNAGLKFVPCNRFIKKAEYLGIKINHNLSILLRCCEQNISHKKSIKKAKLYKIKSQLWNNAASMWDNAKSIGTCFTV